MERERAYPDAELVLGEDGRDLREVGAARKERRHDICIYISIYLSIFLSICLSIYLSIHLSIYIYIYAYIYIYILLCIYVSPGLSAPPQGPSG